MLVRNLNSDIKAEKQIQFISFPLIFLKRSKSGVFILYLLLLLFNYIITSLYERRQVLSETLFDQIIEDPSHKLHDLLPPRNESTYCTRSRRYFELPICKTHRFRKTFIMNHSFNYN